MSEATRRTFITTSGVGVAAVGVAALRSTAPAVAPVDPADTQSPLPPAADGMLVAFVRDVRAGEVSLMVGEKEVIVQDRELVSRLVRATAR